MASSLLYETTYHSGVYMFGTPTKLDSYNEAFAADETDIVDNGPVVEMCNGCFSYGEHQFLAAEGSAACDMCSAMLCRFCRWTEENNITSAEPDSEVAEAVVDSEGAEAVAATRVLCFQCKMSLLSGMGGLTEAEMRRYLSDKQVFLQQRASYADVWQTYLTYHDAAQSFFAERESAVKYPLLPPKVLHESVLAVDTSEIKVLKTTRMLTFAGVVSDRNISDKHKAGLLHLMAELTRPSKIRRKGETLTHHHTVAGNLVRMTEQSRIHKGDRTINRALRHSVDDATPDIITSTDVSLAEFQGATCLIIGHSVNPSMRTSCEYKVKSAITAVDFVAGECQCKAGCSNRSATQLGEEKAMCPHVLTPFVQTTNILYEGLAEVLLQELRNWTETNDLELALTAEERTILRDDVWQLLQVSGQETTPLNRTATIRDWLDPFSVTTDISKRNPGRPNKIDVGLLQVKCRYARPEAKVEKKMQKKEGAAADVALEDAATETVEPASQDDYDASQLLVDAIGVAFNDMQMQHLNARPETDDNGREKIFTPIGFELLQHRSPTGDFAARSLAVSPLAKEVKHFVLIETTKRSLPGHSVSSPPTEDDTTPARASESGSRSSQPSAGRKRKRCCVDWCRQAVGDGEYICVPKIPRNLFDSDPNPSDQRRRTYARNIFRRNEWTERLAKGRSCLTGSMVICMEHPCENVKGKATTYISVSKDGTQTRKALSVPEFLAPVNVGRKNHTQPASTRSRGCGTDRQNMRMLDAAVQQNPSGLVIQQMIEMNETGDNGGGVNDILPLAREKAGLQVHQKKQSRSNRSPRPVPMSTTGDTPAWTVPSLESTT